MVEDTIPGSGLFNGISAERLQQMMAHNHTELFKMNATANGGEVRERSGVVWTNEGGKNKGHIPFPVMTRESAGAIIDEILQYYREREITNIGCWSLHPLPYRAMGVQLLARGFQPGWRPNWMALDLDEINTGYAVPPGLEIIPDNETSTHGLKDLPYSGDNGAVAPAAMKEHAGGIVQRFFAMLDGKIAGQSAVFIPPGGDGACGLYEVGVLPALRNRGIGKAVVTAACVYAKQQGCRYATLNGTGKRMYEQVGFVHIGYGRTWWITKESFLTTPPTRREIALAEGVGYGSTLILDAAGGNITAGELNRPMANKMTLMQLAAYCGKPASGEWLLSHGAGYTALDAWYLGWKERAAALLAANPAEVNRRYDEGGLTLLHIAAQKNDIALAEMALAAKPDVTIIDNWHDGTPLGWARFFERKEIFEMIQRFEEQQKN